MSRDFELRVRPDDYEGLLADYQAERALADDLADVLMGFMPIAKVPYEVSRVLARYREARGRG
jgi:hypothetical protein